MRAAGELRPHLVALFRAHPEVSAAFPAALGCLSRMPRASPAGTLPAAPRAFALPSSHSGERVLASPRIAGEARVSSVSLPPGATQVPRRLRQCTQPRGTAADSHTSAGRGRLSPRVGRPLPPRRTAGSPPSPLSLATTPSRGEGTGRERPPSPTGRAGGPRTRPEDLTAPFSPAG